MSAAWQQSAAESVRRHTLIEPPPQDRWADVWPEPVHVPPGRRVPSWWIVGAHGGAGASMLTASWAVAGDAQRAFPGALGGESPFVVVVARESADGIGRAHDLLTQHGSGYAGPSIVVGLVTVAATPAKPSSELRHRLGVVAGLVDDRHWRIPWIPAWIALTPDDLPTWMPGDPVPTGRKHPPAHTAVPRDVAQVGEAIRDAIVAMLPAPDEEHP